MTLTLLAYLGMLVEALFIVFALIDGDWPALIATLVALAATIATILVTPSSWRRFLPPARRSASTSPGCASTSPSPRPTGCGCCSRRELAPGGPAGWRATSGWPGEAAAGAPHPSRRRRRSPAFHLHERLLPYAVLFGLEREWIAKLQLEHAALGRSNLDTLGDAVDVTADVAERARRRGRRARAHGRGRRPRRRRARDRRSTASASIVRGVQLVTDAERTDHDRGRRHAGLGCVLAARRMPRARSSWRTAQAPAWSIRSCRGSPGRCTSYGFATLRFNFPYREARRRFPDRPPVAIATWRAVMEPRPSAPPPPARPTSRSGRRASRSADAWRRWPWPRA